MIPNDNDLCLYVGERLFAYDDGTLSAEEGERVEGHLVRCGACRARLAQGRATSAIVQQAFEPCAAFVESTTLAMAASAPGTREQTSVPRRPALRLWASVMAVAALLVLAIEARFQKPQLTDARETSAATPRGPHGHSGHDVLGSGRLFACERARSLALPLPPTDGLGRGSRKWPSR